jgi:hypothetical protein
MNRYRNSAPTRWNNFVKFNVTTYWRKAVKKVCLILVALFGFIGVCIVRYHQLNAVPNLRLLGSMAVSNKQSKVEYLRSLHSDSRIFVYPNKGSEETIFAQTDYPFQILPTYLQTQVKFKNDIAFSFEEQTMGSAF